jgi:carboxymethylenebutenolidase
MALRDYLAEEIAEDWIDGLVTRREAVRRLVLLGFTTAGAGALLAACAGAAQTAGPSAAASSAASPAASPMASSAASPAASPMASSAASPAASSAATGAPAPGPVAGEEIRFAGPRGELLGFYAPAAVPRGAMLVIHENRGLTDHIRSVASRLAEEGYSSLAVDLVSEEGGTEALGSDGGVQAALGAASNERLVGDLRAALTELERRAPDLALGAIGFCFGGGMVWALLDAGEPRLSAAIPFYGPAPADPTFDGNAAAVLGVYAERDGRVNATRDRAQAALEQAGLEHRIVTYPGVDHAFFNDTGTRYDPTQAAAAFSDVLAWLGEHLAG